MCKNRSVFYKRTKDTSRMAMTVFQNTDLVRLIYSFDPDHRLRMKDVADQLQHKPYDFTEEFVARRRREAPDEQSFFTILDFMNEVPRPILLYALKTYKRCYCCTRHNLRKPMFHEGQLVTCTGVVCESHPTECRCICRTLSRVIMNTLFS